MSENNNSSSLQTLQFALTIITVISAIVFLNDLFGKGKAGEENDENEGKANESKKELYKKIPPSFPQYQYRDWADSLDWALLREGTEDEEMVYGVFESVKNASDVQKIIDAFGHRRKMFTTNYISLPQAIAVFLSKGEKFKLNYILANKGIMYRFK